LSDHGVITTGRAPAAIGPYSQAVRSGSFLFCSGQIPLDPATGQLVEGGIEAQTAQVLDNLTAVLAAAGLTLRDVVKTTVFLVSMDDFPAMNEVYARYFDEDPPARSTIGVAALPKGARVEIEAIASAQALPAT
jgi:2-iminobutanoate/2-iminopropanoate deaminase